MKKIIFYTLFISILTLAAFWTSRQLCMICMWSGHGPKFSHNRLNLDSDQMSELKTMEALYQSRANQICTQVCKRRMDVLSMIKDPKINPDDINKKIEEVGLLQTELEKETAAHLIQVRKKLSPDEFQKYIAPIQKKVNESIRNMEMMD